MLQPQREPRVNCHHRNCGRKDLYETIGGAWVQSRIYVTGGGPEALSAI
jgi:hypothetical protein